MPKVQAEPTRTKNYVLLVAMEYLQQFFDDKENGIPLLLTAQLIPVDEERTRMDIVFKFGDSDYIAKVFVSAGDIWPKEGTVHLVREGVGIGVSLHHFELKGNSGQPEVKFTRLKGGKWRQFLAWGLSRVVIFVSSLLDKIKPYPIL
jgi:hypothetical protein